MQSPHAEVELVAQSGAVQLGIVLIGLQTGSIAGIMLGFLVALLTIGRST